MLMTKPRPVSRYIIGLPDEPLPDWSTPPSAACHLCILLCISPYFIGGWQGASSLRWTPMEHKTGRMVGRWTGSVVVLPSMYWHNEVGIFEIYPHHPIAHPEQLLEYLHIFHLEVLRFHPLFQLFEVEDWSHLTSFLANKEQDLNQYLWKDRKTSVLWCSGLPQMTTCSLLTSSLVTTM